MHRAQLDGTIEWNKYQNESSNSRLLIGYMGYWGKGNGIFIVLISEWELQYQTASTVHEVKNGKGMTYTHLHSGDIRMRAPISDHQLVLYIGSGGQCQEWHIHNVVIRLRASISEYQNYSGGLVGQGMPYTQCWHLILVKHVIGEGT